MIRNRVLGWALLASLFLVWEAVAQAHLVSPLFLPTLTDVLFSLANMLAGYLLAALTAIPIGVMMGYSRRMHNLLEPAVELSRPLPATALIPLAILFLGVGPLESIAILFITCFRTIIVNAIHGARSVDPRLIETARSYGYRDFKLITRVVIPAASPQIMTGMRISLAVGVVVIIATEMMGSEAGIGYFTMVWQRTYATPEVYVGVLSLCLLGYGLHRLFQFGEMRMMGWHRGQSEARR